MPGALAGAPGANILLHRKILWSQLNLHNHSLMSWLSSFLLSPLCWLLVGRFLSLGEDKMKCKRFLSFSLFVSLASLFMAFSFTSGNVSAVSDLTFTISSFASPVNLCSNYSACSSYHYILIQSNFIGSSATGSVYLQDTSSYGTICRLGTAYSKTTLCTLDSSFPGTLRAQFSNLTSDTGSVTITFSENNPFASSGPAPSGSLSITENGSYDVTSYATAVVAVPPEIIQGDYHDDLQDIKNVAILVPSVMLVIYFFWAIYKMIMGGARR